MMITIYLTCCTNDCGLQKQQRLRTTTTTATTDKPRRGFHHTTAAGPSAARIHAHVCEADQAAKAVAAASRRRRWLSVPPLQDTIVDVDAFFDENPALTLSAIEPALYETPSARLPGSHQQSTSSGPVVVLLLLLLIIIITIMSAPGGDESCTAKERIKEVDTEGADTGAGEGRAVRTSKPSITARAVAMAAVGCRQPPTMQPS